MGRFVWGNTDVIKKPVPVQVFLLRCHLAPSQPTNLGMMDEIEWICGPIEDKSTVLLFSLIPR